MVIIQWILMVLFAILGVSRLSYGDRWLIYGEMGGEWYITRRLDIPICFGSNKMYPLYGSILLSSFILSPKKFFLISIHGMKKHNKKNINSY